MSIKLILQDETEIVTYQIDKTFLINKYEYFKTMFTNFKEKDSQEITMKVPYAHVICDIITSLNDDSKVSKYSTEFDYQLARLICLNFLNLSLDFGYFAKNRINTDDFQSFLNVLDVVGHSDEAIKIITNNIPKNYDLKLFPKNVLQRMQKLDDNYRVVFVRKDKSIKVWNSIDNKLTTSNIMIKHLKLAHLSNQEINVKLLYPFLEISPIGQIVTAHSLKQAIITDIFSENTIKIKQDNNAQLIRAIFSNNGEKIALSGNGFIEIWNFTTKKQLLRMGEDITNVKITCFSPDNEKLAAIHFDEWEYESSIRFWNTTTGKCMHVNEKLTNQQFINLTFTPDSTKIIANDFDGNVYVWNISSDTLIVKKVCSEYGGSDLLCNNERVILLDEKMFGVENSIVICDMNLNIVKQIVCPCHQFNNIAITPDGTRIIYYGSIWNAYTGDLIEKNQNLEHETDKMACIRSELWVKIDEFLAN